MYNDGVITRDPGVKQECLVCRLGLSYSKMYVLYYFGFRYAVTEFSYNRGNMLQQSSSLRKLSQVLWWEDGVHLYCFDRPECVALSASSVSTLSLRNNDDMKSTENQTT